MVSTGWPANHIPELATCQHAMHWCDGATPTASKLVQNTPQTVWPYQMKKPVLLFNFMRTRCKLWGEKNNVIWAQLGGGEEHRISKLALQSKQFKSHCALQTMIQADRIWWQTIQWHWLYRTQVIKSVSRVQSKSDTCLVSQWCQ